MTAAVDTAAVTTAAVKVAALVERAPGERRVALVPEVVARLVAGGYEVMIETGAGAGAFHNDDAYIAAGATTGTLAAVVKAADLSKSRLEISSIGRFWKCIS